MVYLLAVYTIGLGLMILGFVCSPEQEKAHARPIGTMIAYLLWPISFGVAVFYAAWDTYCEKHRGHASG